jgi:hypothetical protein
LYGNSLAIKPVVLACRRSGRVLASSEFLKSHNLLPYDYTHPFYFDQSDPRAAFGGARFAGLYETLAARFAEVEPQVQAFVPENGRFDRLYQQAQTC